MKRISRAANKGDVQVADVMSDLLAKSDAAFRKCLDEYGPPRRSAAQTPSVDPRQLQPPSADTFTMFRSHPTPHSHQTFMFNVVRLRLRRYVNISPAVLKISWTHRIQCIARELTGACISLLFMDRPTCAGIHRFSAVRDEGSRTGSPEP